MGGPYSRVSLEALEVSPERGHGPFRLAVYEFDQLPVGWVTAGHDRASPSCDVPAAQLRASVAIFEIDSNSGTRNHHHRLELFVRCWAIGDH